MITKLRKALYPSLILVPPVNSWKSHRHLWPVISDHRLLNFNFTWQLGKTFITYRPRVRDLYWDILKMSKLMHQIQGCYLKYFKGGGHTETRIGHGSVWCHAMILFCLYNECHNRFHGLNDTIFVMITFEVWSFQLLVCWFGARKIDIVLGLMEITHSFVFTNWTIHFFKCCTKIYFYANNW